MQHGIALSLLRAAFHHRRLPRAITAGQAMSTCDPARRHINRLHWQRLGLLAALLAALWLFYHLFAPILPPFVMAALLAYFLDPAVRRLEHLGLPRWLGAVVLLLALGVAVVLFILQLYPVIVDQAVALGQSLPGYISATQKSFGHFLNELQSRFGPGLVSTKLRDIATNQAGTLVSFAGTAASNIIGGGFAVVNVLTLLIITPIVTFYLLRDWPAIIRNVDSWLPRPYEAVIRAQAVEVNRVLAAWIRGQAICCLILALVYALGLTLIGLNFGLIIGLAAGLLSFIPYVGTLLGGVTAILISLNQNPGWHGILMVLIVFACGQTLNDYVVQPRFLGDRLGLPAVWVIFALFAGGAAAGFLGIMLAVPVTATLGALARFWLRRYLQSPLYLDPTP